MKIKEKIVIDAPKTRKPTAKGSIRHKSKKDYDRKKEKRKLKKKLKEQDFRD